MWVRQHGREASTEVVFDRIEDDPKIADDVFATMRLDQVRRGPLQARRADARGAWRTVIDGYRRRPLYSADNEDTRSELTALEITR